MNDYKSLLKRPLFNAINVQTGETLFWRVNDDVWTAVDKKNFIAPIADAIRGLIKEANESD